MKVTVMKSSTVRPAKEAPDRGRLWLANPDQLFARTGHISIVFPYRNVIRSPNFFDAGVLKESLSKALVPFFPFAGRLAQQDGSGRFEIDCNGRGVRFVEARVDVPMSELGDFQPCPRIKQFVPAVDYSKGFSSIPLFLVQVTRFNCGGVCLGIVHHHVISDAVGLYNFLTTWSSLARGDVSSTANQPFTDRTILMARSPPTPTFQHPEYQPIEPGLPFLPPVLHQPSTRAEVLTLSIDKINDLKKKANAKMTKFTTYEVLAAHLWRCATIARRIDDQNKNISLNVSVNGRHRFDRGPHQPPAGYLGNCVFYAMAVASPAELASEPLEATAWRIKRAIKRIDDGYMRSAIDQLEFPGDGASRIRVPGRCGLPHMKIVSWSRMRFEQDFGWGSPMFTRSSSPMEGMCQIMKDFSISICLEVEAMERFKELMSSVRSTHSPGLLSHM